MKQRILLAFLFACALNVSTGASVINFTVTDEGTPSYSGGVATGFTAFLVQASSPDGVIGGFDFSQNGVYSGNTITGRQISATLLQDWGSSGTATATTANLPGNSRFDAVDSAFLLNTTTAIVGQGASEDNNQSGTTLGSPPISNNSDPNHDFGVGTYLSGAWAYQTANQLSSQYVAWLVVSSSQLAANGGSLTVATPQVSWLDAAGDTSSVTTVSVPLTLSVPEPGGLGLLALCGILLGRRRRAL